MPSLNDETFFRELITKFITASENNIVSIQAYKEENRKEINEFKASIKEMVNEMKTSVNTIVTAIQNRPCLAGNSDPLEEMSEHVKNETSRLVNEKLKQVETCKTCIIKEMEKQNRTKDTILKWMTNALILLATGGAVAAGWTWFK